MPLKSGQEVDPIGPIDGRTAGLTSREAALRLARDGPNEAAAARRHTLAAQVAGFVANPLVLILLLASGVSAAAGDVLNAAIIVVIVVFSLALNAVQTVRSGRAVELLQSSVAPIATVKRDGAWREIPRQEVVAGDLVRLAPGDMVPADCTLLESDDLYVQQAALTGESLPVEKGAGQERQDGQGPEAAFRVFLGTSVTSGVGVALVTATGLRTLFGDVAKQLARRAPETEFERGTRRFGLFITQTVFFLVLFVLLVNVIEKRDPLEAILFAIALAVGLTPEFLPMIVSVTLAQGAVRMARKQVIVKNLSTLQNFGSIDILCSDKTGTLTSGEMELRRAIGPFGDPDDAVLELGVLNSLYGQRLNGQPGDPASSRAINPLDAATLRRQSAAPASYRPVDAIPFDFERRRQSVVVEREGERLLITKGAPESVLVVCGKALISGEEKPLDDAAAARCRKTYEDLHAQGFRALAVARRSVDRRTAYSASDELNLTLCGFLAYSDPPLADADETLRELHRDGVRVKILSGDNELVARSVCESVGLKEVEILKGEEIDGLTDPALAHLAERATVFARVTPAQKNRIIHALKSRGHVVGYLGDGINDAPSLHAADVGISVSTAVDVAREAADIILLERGLRVLHRGILEGRRAFGNVMKYLLMGTSSNFGNVISMAGAALFLPYLPMLPRQILLNNFLYDLAQVAIPTDRVDPVWIRKPRRWDIGLIRRFMLVIGPISSVYDFLTFWALLKWFRADAPTFHTGWFVESLATQTLVLFVIRTEGNPLRSRPSRALALTVLAVVTAGIVIPFTPVAPALGFVPLPPAYFLFLAAATATYLTLVQAVKQRLIRR